MCGSNFIGFAPPIDFSHQGGNSCANIDHDVVCLNPRDNHRLSVILFHTNVIII